MYICENCENIFDEPKIVEEHHPYGMGTATEEWAACPYCGDTDIVEAEKCSRCGNYVLELEDGLCDCCRGDMYGE